MAPLPANNTSRLFVDYTSQSILHTVQLRYQGIQTTPNLVAAYNAFGNGLATFLLTTQSIVGARYQNAGTNFSIALTVPVIPGTTPISGNTWEEDPESAQLSILFRDNVQGRRGRWEVFTANKFGSTWPVDNRYQAGENASIDALINHFEAVSAGAGGMPFPLVSIANNPVVVYQYANICKNGYWEREQRT